MSNSCNCGGGPACTCGCCEGITIAVPQPTANRPGLPALAYRVGTHATFLETMIARLSSSDYPALAALTTRDPADPSIALLDSWALVADVLTFYQERIANEGYLRTAVERRSVLELARLIGYKLRPGVAATVYLAYTLGEDRSQTPPAPTETLIPAGSRSQSVPGPGQTAQFFETSDDLDARSEWNDLGVRLTQPQAFTLNADMGTDITTRDTVYFSGTATNLQPGDALMLVLGTAAGQNSLRLVQSVEVQSSQNRTEVILQSPPLASATTGETAFTFVSNAVTPFIADATNLFPGTSLAQSAAALLSNPPPNSPPGLLENLQAATDKSGSGAVVFVQQTIQQMTELHDLAIKRNFTRLEPWLAEILDTLAALVSQLPGLETNASLASSKSFAAEPVISRKITALSNLTALLPSLALPPSVQPPNSLQLARSVNQTFSQSSDMGPRLLGAFLPAAASMLYRAWSNLEISATTAEVGAVRAKAGLFPGTYPGVPTVTTPQQQIQIARRRTAAATAQTSGNQTVFESPPTIGNDWKSLLAADGSLPTIALDSVYDKIVAGSWILVNRPFNDDGTPVSPPISTLHKVVSTATASMTTADGGFSAKVTQLTLDPAWLETIAVKNLSGLSGVLPGTVVFAQTELLPLAEEPLDADIEGGTIELDGAYDGLESGRWIIVAGERTDIENVTGVTAAELVMILGVAQVTTSPNGMPAPVHTILTLANNLAYTYDATTLTIYGNVVKATNGQTNNEILGNGDSSQSFQEFALKQKPLTFVPASNPDGVSSTLSVYVNNIQWQETDTLAGLGPKDRDYVTQTADDDTTSVIFGNGTQGARPPTGQANVTAIYRNGIGQAGNVDANQISLLQTRPLNVKSVINPLPASGGADRDSLDQARSNAPLAVMSLDRLVSVQDYADFARTFAGIGKASSAKLSDGQRDLVHVTIAGAEDIPIDPTSDLYTNLVQALRVNGDPYQPLQVAVRSLRLLVISAQVKILSDYLWEEVAADLRTALLNTFSFDNRNLGQPVFQSEVISAMQAVAGVAYVSLQILDSVAESASAADIANLATTLALNEFIPAALARRNPSPVNYPTDAILPAEMLYLTPALPDTLILNQVKS
jgi:predicted phage baseplate assembly protein